MPPNAETLRTTNLRTAILSTAALLPFLLSLVFHAIGPAAAETAGGPDRPALTFNQYLVNFGDRPVEPQQFVFARFGFKNNSDRTAVITELKPSCGCLNPRLDKRTYQPGQTGEFFLRVQTANEQPGPKEYFLKLLYEDPQPREATLTLKVVLPEQKVVIEPKALMFYQLGSEPTTREITVTDYRARPLNVIGVESSSELVTAKLDAVDCDAQGNRRLRVSITVAGQVPSGRHRALVTILSDDPVYDKLQVPLLVQGPSSVQNTRRNTGPKRPQRQ